MTEYAKLKEYSKNDRMIDGKNSELMIFKQTVGGSAISLYSLMSSDNLISNVSNVSIFNLHQKH